MQDARAARAASLFEPLRPRLVRFAYGMLGSVADAEDAVQNAFLRWVDVDHATIRNPEAFLRRIIARLCLDMIRAAGRRRECYVGEWLPDPVETVETAETDEEVTVSLMLALERLSPLERAAFLLHDVFGASFDDVAAAIDRTPAAARQLASRARVNVRSQRPRYPLEPARGAEIAAAFFDASRSGDMTTLRRMLESDVALHADGGGLRPAILRPIFGIEAVLAAQEQFSRQFRESGSVLLRVTRINGCPGFVSREADGGIQTTTLQIRQGLICAIYVIRNPDKLRHLE